MHNWINFNCLVSFLLLGAYAGSCLVGGGTTVASAISAFAWPVALLGSAGMIDNAWSMGVSRAQKAGTVLAEVLLERVHGQARTCPYHTPCNDCGLVAFPSPLKTKLVCVQRPINLVGFSLGARVIFFALEALAQRGAEGQGIVANAVLLGAACPNDAARWEAVRGTVAGRLVNGFSTNDWVLGFLYRYNCIN